MKHPGEPVLAASVSCNNPSPNAPMLGMKVFSSILALSFVVLMFGANPVQAQWKSWAWKSVHLDYPFDGGYYLGICFLKNKPAKGWVCGRSENDNGRGYVLRTVDGGKTWKGVIIPNAPQLESIIFLNDSVGYCSGTQQRYSNLGGIYRSSDGGATWTEITPIVNDPSTGGRRRPSLWGCHFYDELNGLVIGGGCGDSPEYFFRTFDGGKNWHTFIGSLPESGLSHVKMLDPNGICYASSSGMIWKSTDGGFTWKTYSATGPKYWQENLKLFNNSFCVATSGTDCLGAGDVVGDIRFSPDLGQSWRRYPTGAPMFGTFLLNDSVAWAAGFDRHVMRSSDKGLKWTNYNCGLAPNSNYDDLFFINDTTGFVIGDGIYTCYEPTPAEPITVQGDTNICAGDSVILKAPNNYSQYVWSTGHVGQFLTVRESGEYWVTLTRGTNCPVTTPSVHVTIRPSPLDSISCSAPNRHLCFGDSAVLQVHGSIGSVLWSTGQTSDSIVVRTAGTFTVQVVGTNGCIQKDSIVISGGQLLKPIISSGGPLRYCEGDSLALVASDGFVSYRWSNGATGQRTFVRESGSYAVVAYDSFGCVWVSDSVKVTVDLNPIEIVDLPGSRFVIDSTHADFMTCDSFAIRNAGTDSLRITPVELRRNMEFSAPQGQFDLLIPPGETRKVQLCYRPSQLFVQRDTMVIGSYCHRVIFVESAGIPDTFNGNTRCNTPVRAGTLSIGTRGLNFYPLYPNPAHDEISVPMLLPYGNQDYQIELFDQVGQLRKQFSLRSADRGAGSSENYVVVRVDVRDLESGLYLVHLRGPGIEDTRLLSIQR